jgi:hypothetical protein
VTPPRPAALRLVARPPGGKAPPPPLGLPTWTPEADAVAVLLDATDRADPRTIAGVAIQLPDPSTLPSGAPVFVLGLAGAAAPFWRLFTRRIAVPRAASCTALLVRGYVDIGATADDATGDDLVWGHVP